MSNPVSGKRFYNPETPNAAQQYARDLKDFSTSKQQPTASRPHELALRSSVKTPQNANGENIIANIPVNNILVFLRQWLTERDVKSIQAFACADGFSNRCVDFFVTHMVDLNKEVGNLFAVGCKYVKEYGVKFNTLSLIKFKIESDEENKFG